MVQICNALKTGFLFIIPIIKGGLTIANITSSN